MNTRISYLYRDASNYKAAETVVVAGQLDAVAFSAALATAARGAGISPDAFSPVDLGLPPAQAQMWARNAMSDDDHIYNELISIEPTEEPATCATSAADLLAAAERAARAGYDVGGAMRALGLDA